MSERHVLVSPQSWKKPESYLDALLAEPWYQMVYKVLGRASISTHEFFISEGAQPAQMPLTTDSISSPMGLGSDSFPVAVQMNGANTYLADSMQFYLELAVRIGKSPAYYLMPSFRDEEADARHLNQFFHAEIEIIGDLEAIQNLAERYVLKLSQDLLQTCSEEIMSVAGTVSHIDSLLSRGTSFPQITFDNVVKKLDGVDGAFKLCETGDLVITERGEALLIAEYGDFFWLTHFPMSTVPFYQARDPKKPHISLSADLMAGIGEILGAGVRACTESDVLQNIEAANVNPASYDWYIRMKRSQPVRTAGFGLGIERFLMWITKTRDIRNWSLLPRDRQGKGPV